MDFEALERLGRLRASGAISNEEFESEKSRLLRGEVDNEPPTTHIRELPDQPQDEWNSASQKRSRGRRIFLVAGSLLVIAVAVVVLGRTNFLGSKSPMATPEIAPAATYALRSKVTGIRIAPTTDLPQNPHGDDPSCSSYEKTPVGSAAKLVRSKGWHVIFESGVGKFDAVSFVGACAPIAGDAFSPVDANVGMYEGDALKAVIYGKRLGFVESSDNSRELRITDKMNELTVGRILVTDKRITVQK